MKEINSAHKLHILALKNACRFFKTNMKYKSIVSKKGAEQEPAFLPD